MSTLTKRNTGDGSRSLVRPWFQDFFDVENFFGRDFFPTSFSKSLPAVNISEDEKAFNIEVAAPGYKKEDFKVNIEDNILSISAEAKKESTDRQNDPNKQYSRREYAYSSFTRSFQLPENVKEDEVSASYNDGILRLAIPKEKQQTKPMKQIEIR